MDASAAEMLLEEGVHIAGRAMLFIDALFVTRATYEKHEINAVTWDMPSQADKIRISLMKHPEYSGSFDSIVFEPMHYYLPMLLVPEEGPSAADLNTHLVTSAWLQKITNDMAGNLGIMSLSELTGTGPFDYSKIEIFPSSAPGSPQTIINMAKALNYDADRTNALGSMIIDLVSSLTDMSRPAPAGHNEQLVDFASGVMMGLFKSTENSVGGISIDYPTLLDNRGQIGNRVFDLKRTNENPNDPERRLIFRIKEGGTMWSANSNKQFLLDWRFTLINDGSDQVEPLFISHPQQWNDWLNGIDVSPGLSGRSHYINPTTGQSHPTVVVRMKEDYRGSGENRDLSLESLIFRVIDNEFGITPYTVVDGVLIPNTVTTIAINLENIHVVIMNAIQSNAARYIRPYDGPFGMQGDDILTGALKGRDPVPGGMRIIASGDKAVVKGDPQVVWGHLFPTLTDTDWAVIKSTLGDDYTISGVWGLLGVERTYTIYQSGTRYFIVRVKDMNADTTGLGINFEEGDLGVNEFETLADYMAYYVIPRIDQLESIINNGIYWAEPFPGIDLPSDIVYDIDGIGRVPYILFPGDRTFRNYMLRQLSPSRAGTITFHHWMPDSDAMHYIDLINVMDGNYNSAPWGYVAGWMIGRVTFLAWHEQLEGMRTLWDKLLDVRKWFGNN